MTDFSRKITSKPYKINPKKIEFRASKAKPFQYHGGEGGDGNDTTPFVKFSVKGTGGKLITIEARADGQADDFYLNVKDLLKLKSEGLDLRSMSIAEIKASDKSSSVKTKMIKIKKQIESLKVKVDPKTGKITIQTGTGDILTEP